MGSSLVIGYLKVMQIHHLPKLRQPIAIMAFNGWNDAGETATGCLTHLMNCWSENCQLIAETDSEEFYDYQQSRPSVFVDNSLVRRVSYPNTNVYAISTTALPFDIVLVIGPEPSFKWQTFTNQLLDLMDDLEVDLVVTLGALLADTPHTRPISITGSSANPKLAKEYGYQISRYEGPTGILGVIQDFCQKRDIAGISLWAAIPHYAAGSPSPKATLAMIEELSDFFDLRFPLGDLPDAAKAWELAVSQIASEDSEISEYVKQLEADKDDEDLEVTTGEALAKEFERYLRRQDDSQ